MCNYATVIVPSDGGTRGGGAGGPGFRTDPMKSRFAPVPREGPLAGLAAALVTGCFLAAPGAMADEERSGFYLRADLGANLARGVTLHGKSNDRASRCDEFINPRYAEIPGCTDPDRGSAAGWQTAFDPAGGVFAGFAAGRRITDWLRLEVETFHRSRSTTRPRRWRARRATPPGSWRARSCAPKTGSGACRHGTFS